MEGVAVSAGTGVDVAGRAGVAEGVEVADGEGTGEGVDVGGGGGVGVGAGGGGVAVGASVAGSVRGTAVDCGGATGPQAAASRARTDVMSASTDDLEPVFIICTSLREINHRHACASSG